jgi:two-component system, OmpR family, response regulator ChvI
VTSTLLNEHDNASLNSPPDSRKDEGDRIRAILVDDDDDYREAATAELEHFGFDVVACSTGEAMLDYLGESQAIDVIILDWKLEGGLGIDFLPQLHDRGVNLPVVFLTGIPTTAYEYAALDGGAVDFVDKARGIPILAKRLQLIVQLSRGSATPPSHETLQCGKLLLRMDIGRAYWDGKDVDLTVTEFKIIYLLVSRAGEYVTYRSIYDCVHHAGFLAGSGEEGFRTNVRSSIKRIRNKFRSLDDRFFEIENYPAFGYRWHGAPAEAR